MLDKQRQEVEQFIDASSDIALPGCRFFEQLQTNVGWFKIGTPALVFDLITASNVAFILCRRPRVRHDVIGRRASGAHLTVLCSGIIDLDPVFLLQEKELIKSCNEETYNMSTVSGRCV